MKNITKQQAATFMHFNAIIYTDGFEGQVIGYGLTPCGPDGYEDDPEVVVSLTIRAENETVYSVDMANVRSVVVDFIEPDDPKPTVTIPINHQTGALLSLALEKQIAKSAAERDGFKRANADNMCDLAARDVRWLRAQHDRLSVAMFPPDPDCPEHPPEPDGSENLIEDGEAWANFTREYPLSDTHEARNAGSAFDVEAAERAAGWDPTP